MHLVCHGSKLCSYRLWLSECSDGHASIYERADSTPTDVPGYAGRVSFVLMSSGCSGFVPRRTGESEVVASTDLIFVVCYNAEAGSTLSNYRTLRMQLEHSDS